MQGGVFGAGVYGGYFGAAQGIILMGILGALSSEPIQRLNGYKNVLATIVNVVAALVFILVARDQIDWLVVLLIAIGSTIGGVHGRDRRAAACRRRCCAASSSSSASSPSSSSSRSPDGLGSSSSGSGWRCSQAGSCSRRSASGWPWSPHPSSSSSPPT